MNLTWETREGILKHGCQWEHPLPVPAAAAQPSLEAQVADAADEIAYTNHDLDDGLRAGLLDLEALDDVLLWSESRREVAETFGGVPERVSRAQTIITLMNRLVTDLVEASASRLAEAGVESVEQVRATPDPLIGYSPEIEKQKRELKSFLDRDFYHHPRVLEMSENGARILARLFDCFGEQPRRLPEQVRARFSSDGEARAIADYVAGMTDRFAIAEHERLVGEGI